MIFYLLNLHVFFTQRVVPFSGENLFAIPGFKQLKSMCVNYIGIEKAVSRVSSSDFSMNCILTGVLHVKLYSTLVLNSNI
jgi:hypothetical protein